MDPRRRLIALNRHPKINRGAVCRLGADPSPWHLEKPDDPAAAARLGVPVRQLGYGVEAVRRADAVAEEELRLAERKGVWITTRLDADYPPELFDHPLPPPVIYGRGKFPKGSAVAMVGARRCDAYGREVAEYFADRLARSGVTVVSGFALGIDQAAHRATVRAGGFGIAVHGCGLDIDYPRNSRALARQIAESGASLSEFPMGREPRAWHFPIRNRVIAALSSAVVVVQAKVKSGSLITAHAALDLGRDVFAVPGSIFEELSLGTNGLLADGAFPANGPDDLLDHLSLGAQGLLFPAAPTEREEAEPRPSGFPGQIFDLVPRGDGIAVEDLASLAESTVDRVLGALLELELGGRIERRPGPVYTR